MLSIMDVIMPTAMTTMHTQEDLQESSRQTAQSAKLVLRALKNMNDDDNKNASTIIRQQCQAIQQVCVKTEEASVASNDKDVEVSNASTTNNSWWMDGPSSRFNQDQDWILTITALLLFLRRFPTTVLEQIL